MKQRKHLSEFKKGNFEEKSSSTFTIPETGAALFSKPTSSSNSVANTEEGNLIDGILACQLLFLLVGKSDCGSRASFMYRPQPP
uniref:Uncharacterized protein n=1 Tax=Anas zonorhyncha TaxID=75864 RepID=A0A8B9U1P4_9AVES